MEADGKSFFIFLTQTFFETYFSTFFTSSSSFLFFLLSFNAKLFSAVEFQCFHVLSANMKLHSANIWSNIQGNSSLTSHLWFIHSNLKFNPLRADTFWKNTVFTTYVFQKVGFWNVITGYFVNLLVKSVPHRSLSY